MREKTIYALGFFDGVHVGHQALLTACRDLADADQKEWWRHFHKCANNDDFGNRNDSVGIFVSGCVFI